MSAIIGIVINIISTIVALISLIHPSKNTINLEINNYINIKSSGDVSFRYFIIAVIMFVFVSAAVYEKHSSTLFLVVTIIGILSVCLLSFICIKYKSIPISGLILLSMAYNLSFLTLYCFQDTSIFMSISNLQVPLFSYAYVMIGLGIVVYIYIMPFLFLIKYKFIPKSKMVVFLVLSVISVFVSSGIYLSVLSHFPLPI